MKKEEIVKALEVCSNYQGFGDCDKCPAREGCDTEGGVLEREALSLIREQDKRIEELTLENAGFEAGAKAAAKFVRAATVQKMVDRLKEKIIDVDTDDATLWMECVTVEDIDQIAKEILEET